MSLTDLCMKVNYDGNTPFAELSGLLPLTSSSFVSEEALRERMANFSSFKMQTVRQFTMSSYIFLACECSNEFFVMQDDAVTPIYRLDIIRGGSDQDRKKYSDFVLPSSISRSAFFPLCFPVSTLIYHSHAAYSPPQHTPSLAHIPPFSLTPPRALPRRRVESMPPHHRRPNSDPLQFPSSHLSPSHLAASPPYSRTTPHS